MRVLILALVVAVLGTAAQSNDPKERVNNSTVKVLAAKRTGEVPGAAFMIGALDGKTFFLTACHVVAEAKAIVIQLFGRPGERIPVSVWEKHCDDSLDLSVIVAETYLIKGPIDQLARADLARVRIGDRAVVMGHPPGRDWVPRETKLTQIDKTHFVVGPKAISGGDSGGPLLDNFGDLIGVNVAEDANNDLGRAVRSDQAYELLDRWRVPYTVLFRVDFCAAINNIIAWSEKDFDEIRGAERKRDYSTSSEWALRQDPMDITGERAALLIRGDARYGPTNKTLYLANFKKHRNQEQAQEVARRLSQQVQGCLPSKERILAYGKNCVYSAWRQRFNHTPIQFVTYLKPVYSEVELIAYRGYERPFVCS